MDKKGLKPSHIARTLAPALMVGLAGGIAAAQEASQTPEICTEHTVERGDTLRKIGRKYYERRNDTDWDLIYQANRKTIGRKPDIIEIGMVLKLPCLPGETPTVTAALQEPVAMPGSDAPSDNAEKLAAAEIAVEVEDEADGATATLAPVVAVQTSISAPSIVIPGNLAPTPDDANEESVAEVEEIIEEEEPQVVETVADPEPVEEVVVEAAPEPVVVETEDVAESVVETETDSDNMPMETALQTALTADPNAPEPILLVTGNGYPPFTDEALPGRGFFTLLVQTAMLRAEPERPYTIKFVNDWDAHLDALMPTLAFDASFPWAEPDCLQASLLSAAEQARCATYKFSDPFYEVVDGFFSRKGSGFDEATNYSEFNGAVICRPEGYTRSHLDLVGLKEPLVTYVSPVEVSACFEMLMRADVDMVSIETQVADDAIAKLGLRDDIGMNPNLAAVRPLTIIVHNDNENGDEFLDMLNTGLQIMRDSGEWYAITSRALMEQAEAES